jgi:uncharacterized protein
VATWQIQQFRVRRIEVPVSGLARELEGFTVALVSDVHVGRFTKGAILGRIAEETNALGVDLVALTGDLVNDSLEALPEALAMIQKMRANHGVFLCEGNHDLIDDGPEFRRRVKAAGLKLLVNEGETIKVNGAAVRVIGTRWTGRVSREQVQGELQDLLIPEAFSIVLTHHPEAWEASRALGVGLTLSGHTHGGQLMWDEKRGFGPLLFRYWSGLYQSGNQSLVVSNGVGNWFPLRVNAPAEIIHLTLRST